MAGGRSLEFAAGTGRIALPLARRGVEVCGIELSEAQVACFRNAAGHLRPGGRFVVEVMVPDLQRLPLGETIRPFHVSASRWGFDEYDVAAQGLVSHHLEVADGEVQRQAVPFRYVWPAELDLMAQLAGMTLAHRWSGWDRAPFTSDSRQHVSVWRMPAS